MRSPAADRQSAYTIDDGHPQFVTGLRRMRVQVTFEAQNEDEGIRGLRRLLKSAWRLYRLKCTETREV